MKKIILSAVLAIIINSYTNAATPEYDRWFCDSTLRIDYTFAGNTNHQSIYVDQRAIMPGWYGRKHNLDLLPVKGDGQITVCDSATHTVIYRHSFSTLYQEWIDTDEAKHTSRSFENVFLVPFPKQTIEVTVCLNSKHGDTTAVLTHYINPKDILIRRKGFNRITEHEIIAKAGDGVSNPINIVFVAEGYKAEEMDSFINDCRIATESIMAHQPFYDLKHRFEVIAVKSASEDSGTSTPRLNDWRSTALGSQFSTFYSDRYLTTLNIKRLHDVLAGIPYEHIIILVNTNEYGGGGIYNSYNLSYTKGQWFKPVVVHEFGHSFAGLADEYEYGYGDPLYFADHEPWEQNITTRCDFNSKWKDLYDSKLAGLHEGAGYQPKGVWRSAPDCRMRTNYNPDFCIVCRRAIERIINFYSE